jgi:cyclic pyranopterin phosphate synthase
LVELGSKASIDAPSAHEILSFAVPPPQVTTASGDPDPSFVPERLHQLLGDERPLPTLVWSRLEAIERWSLHKIANGRRPERLLCAYDEIVAQAARLTHLNAQGEAQMVETGEKPITARRAVAASRVTLSPAAYRALIEGNAPKGDVLGTARVAGIMAAKQTSQLIPLCHPIQITQVRVDLVPSPNEPCVDIEAEVRALDRTGVEMEAMLAASVAALTVYDMLKAIDRGIVIGPTRLLAKSGGKSGSFVA